MGVKSWVIRGITRVRQGVNPEKDQPNWAAALQVFHDGNGVVTVPEKDSITKTHPFVSDGKLSVEEARYAFDYLEHNELIEPEEGSEGEDYVISKDGFSTIHKRELHQQQWDIDLSYVVVASATFLVAILGIAQSQLAGVSATAFKVGISVLFLWALTRIKRPK